MFVGEKLSQPSTSLPRRVETTAKYVWLFYDFKLDVYSLENNILELVKSLQLKFPKKIGGVIRLDTLLELADSHFLLVNLNRSRSQLLIHLITSDLHPQFMGEQRIDMQVTSLKKFGSEMLAVTDGLNRWEFYKAFANPGKFERVGALIVDDFGKMFLLDVLSTDKWVLVLALSQNALLGYLRELSFNPTESFQVESEAKRVIGLEALGRPFRFPVGSPHAFFQHFVLHRGWVCCAEDHSIRLYHASTQTKKQLECHEPTGIFPVEDFQLIVFGSRGYFFVFLDDSGNCLKESDQEDFGAPRTTRELILEVRPAGANQFFCVTSQGFFALKEGKAIRLANFSPLIKKMEAF